jgi:hypothetical protein
LYHHLRIRNREKQRATRTHQHQRNAMLLPTTRQIGNQAVNVMIDNYDPSMTETAVLA